MIIEVFIAQSQSHHPLLDQRLDTMFNLIRVPIILKTPVQPLQDMGALLDFPQQSPPLSELILPPSNCPTTTRRPRQ